MGNAVSRFTFSLLVSICGLLCSCQAHASAVDYGLQFEDLPSASQGQIEQQSRSGESKRSLGPRGEVRRIEDRDGNYIDFHYDRHGRVARLHSKRSILKIYFASELDKSPAWLERNGVLLTAPAIDLRNMLGGMTVVGKSGATAKYFSDDPENRLLIDYVRDYCWACAGSVDDVQSAINNLASWFQVGMAAFGALGFTTEILTGATAAEALVAAGAYGFMAVGAVLVGFGGYAIGTFVYDQFGSVVWVKFF